MGHWVVDSEIRHVSAKISSVLKKFGKEDAPFRGRSWSFNGRQRRLFITHQNDLIHPACHSRVHQRLVQQAGCPDRNNHTLKMTALAFVDSDGVCMIQCVELPGFKQVFDPFKVADAAVRSPTHVVPGEFEGWRLRVNSTPNKALATYGC